MAELLINVTPFRSVLKESKTKPGVFEVEGIMQRATAENQNGRVYAKPILERETKRYLDEFVKNGNAFGELDHPDKPVVELKNASHVVKDLWWDGDDLMGKVELLNTPAGNIVKEIIKAGHTIGISSRGTGSVTQTNEGTLEVQPDFELVYGDNSSKIISESLDDWAVLHISNPHDSEQVAVTNNRFSTESHGEPNFA